MAKSKTLELSIQIAGKMDKSLTAALKNSQGQISSFSKSISNLGTAGLAAMGALATGTIATIAACTKEAAKFENYMADVVKVVDGMADETGKASNKLAENGKTFAENYAALEERLKELSTQIPYTFEDLTRLAAAAGQSGKSFEDLMETDFLKNIAMWGTAMDISADQAGDWGAKWEQAFNMNHDQIMEVADVINYLGNNYATTAAEIAESVNDAASMGQIAGVDVKATAAIAASMQAMGVSADVTGTSIKRIYTNITKGSMATANQQKAMERLGFTATGLAAAMQMDGTGTLLKVFEAINSLPGEEKLSTLNALFGQWAIEGGAKITQNLSLLTGMLQEISDPSLWKGSMEKEFIIKATTPQAIETMLGNTRLALMDDIGTAFLPAYKEFGLSMIDFMKGIRGNMPELTQLANTLGELASRGVQKLGDAMDASLPYIQQGLDYLLNNGDKVAKVIGGLAAAFVGMKFAPAAEGLLSGAGSLLFGGGAGGGGSGGKSGGLLGGIKNLFRHACKGKRYRLEVMGFTSKLEGNLLDVQRRMKSGSYELGPYRKIWVFVPKKRLVMALDYPDRIVQWCLYLYLNPIYDKLFIEDSYACRKGKGSHKAAKRLQYWMRQVSRKPGAGWYCLKLDISKYFYRVNHDKLLEILARRIEDREMMKFVEGVVNSKAEPFGLPRWRSPDDTPPEEWEYDKAETEESTMSNSPLVNYVKISPNKTSPRNNKIKKITIHHMAGNLSVETCGNVFAPTSRQASSNYGIGSDGRVGMYVEEKDRAWTSSNADNDNQAVTIEVANNGGAPNWPVSDKAMAKLIELCVDICERNGIEKLNFTGDKSGNLTMHKYFAKTACPGPYLESKFQYIADEVNKRLGAGGQSTGSTGGSGSSTLEYKVGDIVNFTGDTHYTSATSTSGKACKPGQAKVTAVAPSGKHPYHLIKNGGTCTVYGWVDAADISGKAGSTGSTSSGSTGNAAQETTLSVGDVVKMDKAATVYGTSGKFASWVYGAKLYVRQINGSRIVVSTQKTGAVTGAVDKKYLTKV